LLGARFRQARTIVAIDLSAKKLAIAQSLGATHLFEANDPHCIDAVRDATQGGVEFAFEMAGSAKAMELAYRITRRGGTTVTAGLSHPQAMSRSRMSALSPRSERYKAATSAAACPRGTFRVTSNGFKQVDCRSIGCCRNRSHSMKSMRVSTGSPPEPHCVKP
jgi:alcohol dehydrogenase